MRRGIALYHLDRLEPALESLKLAMSLSGMVPSSDEMTKYEDSRFRVLIQFWLLILIAM